MTEQERLDWPELAARSLARQFPPVGGVGATGGLDGIAALLAAVGPLQTQTARSSFLGIGARLDVGYDDIVAAFESFAIVRGSTLRGTVHTSTLSDHALLDAVTRVGQRALWQRTLRPSTVTMEQVWDALEEYADDDWRTPAELADQLRSWLSSNDPDGDPQLTGTAGRYFAFGHGGLIRRPLSGGWEGQGAAGYRAARSFRPPFSGEVATATIRRHLTAHGPSSRRDIAWWSGLGLRAVDAGLAGWSELAGEPDLVAFTGPDDLTYWDLPDAPAPIDLPGVRLLPEFDALICGYAPAARERFVDAEHYPRLWNQGNGLMQAPLLHRGRLTGWWRLDKGSAGELQIGRFGGRRPPRSEVDEAVDRLVGSLGCRVDSVTRL